MTEGRRLRSGCEGRQGAAPGLGCGFLEAPLRAHTNDHRVMGHVYTRLVQLGPI